MRVSILLALVFTLVGAFAQTRELDSLKIELSHHRQPDTSKVNLLNDLSYHYRWMDFALAQQMADSALELAKKLQFTKGVAVADNRLAHCLWATGDNELAIEKGFEAAAIAEKLHLPALLGESFQVIARGYMDQRETKKAQAYIHKAELISLKTTDWDLQSRVYNLAGVILFVKEEKDSALLMYKKALAIIRSHRVSQAQMSQIVSNIGECYSNSDLDLSIKYFTEALELAKANETRNRSAEAAVSGILGNALLKKKKYQEAEGLLLECLRLARELGSKRSARYAYARLANLKMLQGKSAEALEYQKKYYEVNDSLLNVTKTRKIVELESKYLLEKKEHAIQLLERDREIQKLWTNILITAFIMVGIVSAVLYYLQEFRDRKNRTILNLEIDQLMTQNKELSEKYKAILMGSDNQPIESSDQRLLKKAIEVIETNISDPAFGVEQMSNQLNMSRTNMHRKIKAITGFPPSELIRNIRLRKAATLLMNKADSVSQISYLVGFEDHSYFSKSFKKQFGVSPSEYAPQEERLN